MHDGRLIRMNDADGGGQRNRPDKTKRKRIPMQDKSR
jgi:hypothetical protein